jgi:hypothetical protein
VNERRLAVLTGLLAALPVLVSTIHAIATGWKPVFDEAIVAVRAFDVFSSASPLVGQFSDASLKGEAVYNAGPLLFWLLAVPVRLPGNWALPLTMGAVNTACIVGSVLLARRRGGRLFMFATAVAVAAMSRSLPEGMLYTVLNPWSALFPLTLLFFLAWSVACGEYALLPLTALVASFALQAHFSLVVPVLCCLAVAGVGLAVARRSGRSAAVASGRLGWRGSLLATLAVAVVCWSAPLLDQAIHRPGNLVHIVDTVTTHEPRFGTSGGWHAAVRAVGVRPWWLAQPAWNEPLAINLVTVRPRLRNIVSAILIIAALAAAAVVGVRRRRLDMTAVAMLALLLTAAIVVATRSTPSRLSFSVLKGIGWASPAGMFTWLALAWSYGVLLARPARNVVARLELPSGLRAAASSPVAGLAVTALVAGIVAIGSGSDRFQSTFGPVGDIDSHLDLGVPKSTPVLVRTRFASPFVAFRYHTALVYQLRRDGYRPVLDVPGAFSLVDKLGASYSANRHRPDRTVYLEQVDQPPRRAGSRVLARISLPPAPDLDPPFTLVLSVAPGVRP